MTGPQPVSRNNHISAGIGFFRYSRVRCLGFIPVILNEMTLLLTYSTLAVYILVYSDLSNLNFKHSIIFWVKSVLYLVSPLHQYQKMPAPCYSQSRQPSKRMAHCLLCPFRYCLENGDHRLNTFFHHFPSFCHFQTILNYYYFLGIIFSGIFMLYRIKQVMLARI